MSEQQVPTPGLEKVGIVAERVFGRSWSRQRKKGMERYGTELMTLNGRDPFRDAVEEAVDLVQYITQMAMEKEVVERLFVLLCQKMDESRLSHEDYEEAKNVYKKIRARQLRDMQVDETALQEGAQ